MVFCLRGKSGGITLSGLGKAHKRGTDDARHGMGHRVGNREVRSTSTSTLSELTVRGDESANPISRLLVT
jgi:hypothetical protein